MGRPIATNVDACASELHVRIVPEMHTLFPAISLFLVVFGRFLAPRHPPDSGPAVCTRLKKMQATVCIKMGSLASAEVGPKAQPLIQRYGVALVSIPSPSSFPFDRKMSRPLPEILPSHISECFEKRRQATVMQVTINDA